MASGKMEIRSDDSTGFTRFNKNKEAWLPLPWQKKGSISRNTRVPKGIHFMKTTVQGIVHHLRTSSTPYSAFKQKNSHAIGISSLCNVYKIFPDPLPLRGKSRVRSPSRFWDVLDISELGGAYVSTIEYRGIEYQDAAQGSIRGK
ncbi:predicted protein [Sclerotinia sclerotiorum 1980 UF-70]|uniref:Uncharacterized protein n=1 Tax=Sclerotinia sclerotiorum (strain ATCC 18683 / 1980 / Ss-1) TaxID=665079 RepID=A7F1A6_SCLS1|nr:predicted protein [Sclerotinia sclerotiorum 1980 UF-70]EDN95498.1 predicted protein [Sclerotinia sclerotiorum 1980 UF-70]